MASKRFCRIFLTAFLLVPNLITGINGARLNDFIEHYEVLDYDKVELHQKHTRVRRWIQENGPDSDSSSPDSPDPEPSINFHFSAHSRNFNLRLKRDTSVFGPHFHLRLKDGESSPFAQNAHLFEGELTDIPGSQAYGSIQDGIFDGKITVSPDEVYYVEKINKFSLPAQNQSQHSVIYAAKHVADLDSVGSKDCGLNAQIKDWMNQVQRSKVEPNHEETVKEFPPSNFPSSPNPSFEYTEMHDRYLHRMNKSSTWKPSYSVVQEIVRKKRNTGNGNGNTRPKTTCTLHIRTDPTLWSYISERDGVKDKAKIREEILSIIGQHVKTANEIFTDTPFQGTKVYHGIQFVVQTVDIDTDEECQPDYKGTANSYCAENIDVSNFLDIHSRTNYDDHCLSYAFTYRDFTGGVVGLAWVAPASTSGSAGGICEKFTKFREGLSVRHRSLNTGIVTFLNYNRLVPPKVSQLAFTHEVGHNFGASHDVESSCQPGGKDGNFIMYASSTSGYLKNNARFSQCSIESIGTVLDRVMGNDRKNCFTASEGTFCGNKIVEEGEECDCGYSPKECSEVDKKCCSARTYENKALNPSRCTLTPSSDCSPTQGPCCTENCRFTPSTLPCRHESECTAESFCDGQGAACPIPAFKPDRTSCNNGTQVCLEGECRGSICLKYDYEECYLSSADYKDKSTLCELACLTPEGKCMATSDLSIPELTHVIKLRPGAPCDNFRGYCDVFSKCRAVDEKGPLLRLKRMLFNKHNFRNFSEWATKNWWILVLIGIGFLILMSCFIKCCAVHTPSSNPTMPKNLKFSETLRRPIHTLKRRPKPGTAGAGEYEMSRLNGPRRGHRNPDPRSRRYDEESDPFH